MTHKILVIEDELPLLQEIQDILGFEGFETIGAGNGVDGVRMAQECEPDLILCDVLMPGLDGYGVLVGLHSNPTTTSIPFIFVTAKTNKEDLRRGMELGADDYLTKPFTYTELLSAVTTQLQKHAAMRQEYEARLNTLRENILITIPHELRTPLTCILGFGELILASDETVSLAEIHTMAGYVVNAGNRLHRHIENYLLYAQLAVLQTDPARIAELHTHQTDQSRCPLTEIATEKARQWQREADLVLVLDGNGAKVTESSLRKIAEELIDNAFKFSQAGTPVQVTTTTNEKSFVLRVSDQGCGMSDEQLKHIDAFIQFDRKRHEQQGSGLGLFLAKRLAELYGGHLTIKSVQGQGTRVSVELVAGEP